MKRGWLTFGIVLLVGVFTTTTARAQNAATAWSAGPAIYVGPGYFPGYGYYTGVHPGVFIGNYPGFYGNGLSMYGPPVPNNGPIPGYFGGNDLRHSGSVIPGLTRVNRPLLDWWRSR